MDDLHAEEIQEPTAERDFPVAAARVMARGNRLMVLLHCLCRHSLPLTGVTPAGLCSLPSGARFTYLISQANVSDKLRKLLDVWPDDHQLGRDENGLEQVAAEHDPAYKRRRLLVEAHEVRKELANLRQKIACRRAGSTASEASIRAERFRL